MEQFAFAVGVLAVVFLGLSAGALLAEAAVLVPSMTCRVVSMKLMFRGMAKAPLWSGPIVQDPHVRQLAFGLGCWCRALGGVPVRDSGPTVRAHPKAGLGHSSHAIHSQPQSV